MQQNCKKNTQVLEYSKLATWLQSKPWNFMTISKLFFQVLWCWVYLNNDIILVISILQNLFAVSWVAFSPWVGKALGTGFGSRANFIFETLVDICICKEVMFSSFSFRSIDLLSQMRMTMWRALYLCLMFWHS